MHGLLVIMGRFVVDENRHNVLVSRLLFTQKLQAILFSTFSIFSIFSHFLLSLRASLVFIFYFVFCFLFLVSCFLFLISYFLFFVLFLLFSFSFSPILPHTIAQCADIKIKMPHLYQ